MSSDLISKKTRNELCEYFVGNYVLRDIEQEFDAADIPWAEDHKPNVSGARRYLVFQYYHSVDFTSWRDVRKMLVLFGNVLRSSKSERVMGQHPQGTRRATASEPA